MRRLYSGWTSIGLVLLAGCSSPSFVNPPPASYHVSLAAEFNGIWANEAANNGERVRVSGQANGTVNFAFFKTQPSREPMPKALIAQTLHFDNTDWLLLDWNKLSASQGEKFSGKAPYKLLKYVLEKPDRLCGIVPGSNVFVEAIAAGQLEGEVNNGPMPNQKTVTVTSTGLDWVNWWNALPQSKKVFGEPVFCLKRMNE